MRLLICRKTSAARDVDKKRQGVIVFFIGALAGLAAAGVFGYVTFPDDPYFEGSGGYHFIAMLIVYPVTSLVSGIIFFVGFRLRERRKTKNG